MLICQLSWWQLQPITRTTACAATVCDLEYHRGAFGTALHQAAYVGAAAAVQELLNAGASVNARNMTYAQTPLHVACSRNHRDVVHLLLEHGSDPSFQDRDGLSSLGISRLMGSDDAEDALQEHAVARAMGRT